MRALTEKAQATRERILAAAERLFHRHGYHATGLDRIIAEAGVTKGNFYYHFKSKEMLAIASLERHFDRMGSAMHQRARAGSAPLDTLLGMLDFFVETIEQQKRNDGVVGCYFGNFSLELGGEHEAVRKRLQRVFASFRAHFEDLLEQARNAGDLPAERDPEQIAGVIVSLLEGAILLDKASQEPREIRRAVAFLNDYLRRS